MALSEELVHKYSDLVLAKLNKTVAEVRRLFLVEDLVDSIKVSGSRRNVWTHRRTLISRLQERRAAAVVGFGFGLPTSLLKLPSV